MAFVLTLGFCSGGDLLRGGAYGLGSPGNGRPLLGWCVKPPRLISIADVHVPVHTKKGHSTMSTSEDSSVTRSSSGQIVFEGSEFAMRSVCKFYECFLWGKVNGVNGLRELIRIYDFRRGEMSSWPFFPFFARSFSTRQQRRIHERTLACRRVCDCCYHLPYCNKCTVTLC